MNIADARDALAALLGAVPGITMFPKVPNPPKVGSGFLLPSRVQVADSYRKFDASFDGMVFLGVDLPAALAKYADLAVPVVQALTESDLGVADVSTEFELNADGAYYLAVGMTLEVD